MFKKTVEGITKLLKGVFGKKPNKKFKDKIAELPKERQEKIEVKKEVLKKALLDDGLMHMSKLGLADIVLSEAITTTRYKDSANVWTIGIGATRSEIKDLRTWANDKQLSLEEVFKLFTKGIEKYSHGVRKALKVEVSQHMFDGLVSFAYNVGVGGMRKSSLIRDINKGVTDKRQLKALLMRWTKITQNGRKVVSRGLVNRRNAEAEVMFDGKYKNKSMIGKVVPVSAKMRPMYRSKRVKTIDLNKFL
jgi:lysozyme